MDVKLGFHLVISRARSMFSNLLSCTVRHSTKFLVSLWLSRIRSLLEYGSCVWNVDLGLDSLFEVACDSDTSGHRSKLAIPVCRSEVRRRSFAVRIFSVWNSLPLRVVEADSVECFNKEIGWHTRQ